MFRSKKTSKIPTIRVIKIKQRAGDKTTVVKSTSSGWREETTTTSKGVDTTIVLLSKDGELMTKEFNGHWDLEDIKTMEEGDMTWLRNEKNYIGS